jgi:hypothetical protein
MIVQIELQLSKCTRLVQSDVKILFEVEDRKTHVCKLKQTPRSWCGRIDSFLKSLGFTKSKVDSNLYFKVMNDDPMMFPLYADDLFLTDEEKNHH